MAHFAELDENDVVLRVIVVHDNELMEKGEESEAKGIAFCQSLYGKNTRWVQTSYNANGDSAKRFNYAGIGYQYDSERDGFVPPKAQNTEIAADQVLDEETLRWKMPKEMPADADTKDYRWDAASKDWVAE